MMAAQWRTEGKVLMADSLTAVLMNGPGLPWGPRDGAAAPHNPLTRAAVLTAARDTTVPRSARFERLGQLGLAPCTDLRELIYGPTATVRQAYADAAPMYARSPQESAAYEVVTRGIGPQGGGPALPGLFKPAGWVLGKRARGCGALIVGGVM